MCGCNSNFDGNESDELLSFDGGGSYTDFVDDLESGDDFDNFLTKKMRERRRIRKEAIAGGMTKEEAKQKALAQVPRQKLKDIIGKLKAGRSVISVDTPQGKMSLSTDPTQALDQLSTALADSGTGTGTGTGTTLDTNVNDTSKADFLGKNGKYILIGAVVIIGGYFAWKKFGK
jgi:hypothetical protein